MNKKAMQIEGIVKIIIFLGLGFMILFLLLASITPTMFDRAGDLNQTTAGSANASLTNTSATDLAGGNCIAGSETCYNYSGGAATTTLGAGNITWTDSTCSVVLTDAGAATWNNTNILCNYTYRTSYQYDRYEAYGNISSGIINLSEESADIVPIAWAIMGLVLLFVAYGLYKRYME